MTVMYFIWVAMLIIAGSFYLFIRYYDRKFKRLHDAWIDGGKQGKYPGCDLGHHPLIFSRAGNFCRCPECGLKMKLVHYDRFDFDGDMSCTHWVEDKT